MAFDCDAQVEIFEKQRPVDEGFRALWRALVEDALAVVLADGKGFGRVQLPRDRYLREAECWIDDAWSADSAPALRFGDVADELGWNPDWLRRRLRLAKVRRVAERLDSRQRRTCVGRINRQPKPS